MIDNYEIMLYLDKDKKEILAKVKVNFLSKVYNLRLIINEGLVIDNIIDDKGNNIIFHEEFNINEIFIESGKRITLEVLDSTNYITIVYSGKISGWHNSISDTQIALNYYSAWYPIFVDYDMSIEKKVTIKNIDGFTVIKGKKTEDEWIYRSSDFDCNIIAVKDWNLISKESVGLKLNVYFKNSKIEEINYLAESFDRIIDYFTRLLDIEKSINDTFDIVISKSDKGGYCRKGLIVLCDLPSERINVDAFLAHECGHIWATGADVNSWEDWLNETFAEVLSLCFIKKQYGTEGYITRINRIREIAEKSPQIKSKNGERPDGVHFKGVYLMHILSEYFGEDKLIEIIKIFVKSSKKTTENMLGEIKEKLGQDIAKFIEYNLTKI